MKAMLCLSIFIMFYLEWCHGGTTICPQCFDPLSISYNAQNESIEGFLDLVNGKSVFAAAFESLLPSVTDIQDHDYLTNWINIMETEIIQNDSIATNRIKILKLGMKIDQLFLIHRTIKTALEFQIIKGKNSVTWGPLCNFQYIVNEWNIPTFWELATTPGTTTACLIYDLIMDASKGSRMIQNTLCLEEIPCTQSFEMVNRILQLHFDIPTTSEITNLLSLQLPNFDITVHQCQQIARAYYSTTSISCRRIKDMFSNYPASNFKNFDNNYLGQILTGSAAIPANSSPQYCIDWWSGEVANRLSIAEGGSYYYEYFSKMFWNPPYGSFYDNMIYLSCQKNVLISNAPQYYS